jgi:hypothetical protein
MASFYLSSMYIRRQIQEPCAYMDWVEDFFVDYRTHDDKVELSDKYTWNYEVCINAFPIVANIPKNPRKMFEKMKHLADNVFEVPMPPELGVIMEMTLAVC